MARHINLANDLSAEGLLDLAVVQAFWIGTINDYFNNLPFTLVADSGRTLSAHLDDLFEQVRKLQTEASGDRIWAQCCSTWLEGSSEFC